MGELNQHNLQNYIDKYGLVTFVETGTGIGTGLEYALRFPFKRFYSIEIMTSLFDKCKAKFSSPTLINSNSIDGLKQILPEIKDPTLFWLDAHYPGADFQLGSYDDVLPPEIKTPLEKEIELITSLKDPSKDVLIIDDLRLYEKADYELGPIKESMFLGPNAVIEIMSKFGRSHKITRDYRHQGFLILEPK